jgi:uncharacterized protein YcfJ
MFEFRVIFAILSTKEAYNRYTVRCFSLRRNFMKKIIILASLISMATLANAQQVGRVISSTPITQTVSVPQQTCSQSYVSEPVYNANGGGAVIGAIAGGLIGSAVGGALIGSQVNSGGGYVSRFVQNCYTQNSYQNNVTGYDVVYELNGGTYTTQTSTPLGRYINVGNNYNSYNSSNYTPPTYYQPAPVYTPPAVYVAPPVYYAPPPVYYRPYHHYRGW